MKYVTLFLKIFTPLVINCHKGSSIYYVTNFKTIFNPLPSSSKVIKLQTPTPNITSSVNLLCFFRFHDAPQTVVKSDISMMSDLKPNKFYVQDMNRKRQEET